jgi:hypothetical protein
MTDLLDRPAMAEPGDQRGSAAQSTRPTTGPEHLLLAAALFGAGAIHMAMAPSHLGESAVEGIGFLVAAWAQLSLAVAVLLRPARAVLTAVGVISLVLIGAWALSRTVGLPFGSHAWHPESVSIVDGVCVALEGVALMLAVGVLSTVARARGVAFVGAVGAVVLATAAVASPAARDHAAQSHGDHGHDREMGSAVAGHDHGTAATGADDGGFSQLANGHQHERGSNEPLTPEQTVALAGQLAATAELVERYPTIADAEAAGWRRAGPFSPGLGTHYMGPNFAANPDGDMDPEDLLAPMLVYDGLAADAKLAGFMYLTYGRDTEPEGFAGPNDHWHYHERVCLRTGAGGVIDTPFGADLPGLTEQMCHDAGGSFIKLTGYMVHVWNVPGYESPDGMFTELNRRITCPDGTYHRIPLEELGSRDSTCRNP